ncbi:MAG TPA: HDOD domain-containing protein [Anaeromyxobacteraceae bacterium]|nr:HDOD domain-containing protein [Anaeromyxobacteraceae bacterium]
MLKTEALTDADGLSALKAEAKDQPLSCEPSLAEAGKPFGVESSPLPQSILPTRAALAYAYAYGLAEGGGPSEVLPRFLEASARFWGAKPWEVVDASGELEVRVSVGRQGRRGRAHVRGPSEGACSLTLESESDAGTQASDSTQVVFEAPPDFALPAAQEAFGLAVLPVVKRRQQGADRTVTSQDLIAVAALLAAVASLAEADDPTSSQGFEAVVGVGALAAMAHVSLQRVAKPAEEPAEELALDSIQLHPHKPEEPVPPPALPEPPTPPAPPEPVARASVWKNLGARAVTAVAATVRAFREVAHAAGRAIGASARAPFTTAAERLRRVARRPSARSAGTTKEPVPPPPPSPEAPPPAVATAPPVAESPKEAAALEENLFAPFARLLGMEVPAESAPLLEDEERSEVALAAQILEGFAAAPPARASFPAIALHIMDLVASDKADVASVAGTISRDPALSAGVISVANSAVFRGVSGVETVREAVARLGLQEVGRVAAAVSTKNLFTPQSREERALFGGRSEALFARSVAVGSAAASAAMRQRGARSDRVYLGGLLHDIGKALALQVLSEKLGSAGAVEVEPDRLERVLDRVHASIGSSAHTAWALPQYLTSICEHHHDPDLGAEDEYIDLHLVRLASALAELHDSLFAARAAREIVQSAGALKLDPYGVRALHSDLFARLGGSPASAAQAKGLDRARRANSRRRAP